jgi:oligopeptide transport system ATP-binding protein
VSSPGSPPLLEVRDLTMHFPVYSGRIVTRKVGAVRAVDGVSFQLRRGETLGLVGESGCGKSTTGRAILQLHRPTSGSVRYEGVELTSLRGESLRAHRLRMQMIFQDPYASLNPRMTIGEIIAEPIINFGLEPDRRRRVKRIQALMESCGLNPAYVKRYPHEFSGGQRQRIGIARALASEPEFIVADEPISALDVSIQAQIMNLMQELGRQRGLTYLFISHDLSAVRHLSDRVAVMYLGTLVELAPAETIHNAPLHPYTQALISAVPIPDPEVESQRERVVLKGDVPSPMRPPPGCRFHTRCPIARERCKVEVPALLPVLKGDGSADPGHLVACHLVARAGAEGAPPNGARRSPDAAHGLT